MATTYKLISSVTVGSGGSASMVFTSIPATYTDLIVKLSAKTNRTTDYVDDFRLSFNSSSSGYITRALSNYNGTVRSDQNASASYINAFAATANHSSATPTTFCNSKIYIPNYTSSAYKSVVIDSVTEQDGTQTWQTLHGDMWQNTAAITSITLIPDVGTVFTEFSTAYLYGISNA